MKTAVIAAAILSLAPHVGRKTSSSHARHIHRAAVRYDVHPLLMVAIAHIETSRKWNPRLVSRTTDYGLMQVHVAVRGSARFLGRELQLFDPAINFREGARILRMWKNYHDRTCTTPHPYWAHYKWGFRVKNIDHALKVLRLYRQLKDRFQPSPPPIGTT